MNTTPDTRRIAELNDLCRKGPSRSGRWSLTAGIYYLSEADQSAILEKVRSFQDFTPDNNPHGERDFGAFMHNGQHIFWKIDYYDRLMQQGSENPADPIETTRVLTIMLASEY
jgi:hypothetical protein